MMPPRKRGMMMGPEGGGIVRTARNHLAKTMPGAAGHTVLVRPGVPALNFLAGPPDIGG